MITGYDAHGNFLPPQQLIDEIERLRTDRNAVIEECALLVAERAIWTSDRDIKDTLIAVAAAIRALKDKP